MLDLHVNLGAQAFCELVESAVNRVEPLTKFALASTFSTRSCMSTCQRLAIVASSSCWQRASERPPRNWADSREIFVKHVLAMAETHRNHRPADRRTVMERAWPSPTSETRTRMLAHLRPRLSHSPGYWVMHTRTERALIPASTPSLRYLLITIATPAAQRPPQDREPVSVALVLCLSGSSGRTEDRAHADCRRRPHPSPTATKSRRWPQRSCAMWMDWPQTAHRVGSTFAPHQ